MSLKIKGLAYFAKGTVVKKGGIKNEAKIL